MKFLTKYPDSPVLASQMIYKLTGKNDDLRNELMKEQKHFCAYTEKYVELLDSPEVEHFNSAIKGLDDYYNYYVVVRTANLYKKDEKYVSKAESQHGFFNSHFFQNRQEFESRIMYKEGYYYPVEEQDIDARELIDFLGFNDERLVKQRKGHINRLRSVFEGFPPERIREYFTVHVSELSFITAIEKELQIELESLLP